MRAAAKAAVTPPRPLSYTLSYIQHDSWCFLSSGVVDYDRRGKEGDLYAVLTRRRNRTGIIHDFYGS